MGWSLRQLLADSKSGYSLASAAVFTRVHILKVIERDDCTDDLNDNIYVEKVVNNFTEPN